MSEIEILEISLQKVSEAFDEFVNECTTEDGKPKQPSYQAIMKAKGFLPPYCKHSFKKATK